MSYKITIANNENGKVLVYEENAVAIVGAIGNGQGTRSIGFTDCDAISLGDAISAAKTVISEIKNQAPIVDVLLQLKAMNDKTKANNSVESVQAGRCCLKCDIARILVKEFAEKLKKKFDGYEATYYNGVEEGWHDLQEEIDELLKQYGIEVEE